MRLSCKSPFADNHMREEAEEPLRFLARASAVLASSLDYDTTVTHVACLPVPTLADWCFVDVVGEEGGGRRVAVGHADPTKSHAAHVLSRIGPPDEGAPCGYPSVLRTGAPELIPNITDSLLSATVCDAERRTVLRELGVRAQIGVPLVARGRTLAAMTLVSAESGRDYGPPDLALAEDLAQRAAMALDNAQLYREVQAANAAKAEFLAAMSHEFRTPLMAVRGFADLLTLGIPEPIPDRARRHAQRIIEASDHLRELVEQLLGFSRLEAQRETARVTETRLSALIRELTLLVEPLAREKGLRLSVRVRQGPTVLKTDIGKVRQILFNLLANAVKFTEHGEVTLTAGRTNNRLVLEVRDTGIGIAPDDLQRVFDPFWQVERSAATHPGGTGLGLSIVHRLTRLLGGDVRVSSTVGHGTTFTVELPVEYQET